jgi:hypothetical protein
MSSGVRPPRHFPFTARWKRSVLLLSAPGQGTGGEALSGHGRIFERRIAALIAR